ncbi:methionyl-tRNA formyltransferase [Candidatus Kuenenbacteria bacterium]|nr:methionyl-tRNA formyltransferase [Candidatus Kuenenbacteria bacterium]
MNITNKPKIIFFGTSEFAATILKKLHQSNICDIPLVVTQPDEPKGRQQLLAPPPIKEAARNLDLSFIQPKKLDHDFEKIIKTVNADAFIVVAYGKIIPKSILDLPTLGCINIHPSLLPLYRGPSPIQTSLLNGDKKTGTTIMVLDEKMDHGPILKQIDYPISPNDTFITLSKKLAEASAELLIDIFLDFYNNKIKPQQQDHTRATYTKIIERKDGQIDWSNTAQKIYDQWRAFILWPNIFSHIKVNNKNILIKFNELKISDNKPNSDYPPGQLFVYNEKLLAACGQNTYLEIAQLQPEGKKIMSALEFINGHLK